MVAELVETSRLWGRTAARIQPGWIEPLAEHLVKRTYDEPHWERRRAAVVATERVTLYGLPVVTARKVPYGPIDPEASRALFIRRALVEGDWDTRHSFFHANRRLLAEVEALEQRVRRRDLLVEDQVLFDFYEKRIPPGIASPAHFDRWWKDERRRRPDALTFPRELVLDPRRADAIDGCGRPETWRHEDLALRLSYSFEPGADHDGVTVHVPLKALPRLRSEPFGWLVPALRRELVIALIRSLPKHLRRPLVPVPELAEQVLEQLEPGEQPLVDALAREIERLRGVRVPRDAWDVDRLPAHLRMGFRVEDERGQSVAEGHDLDALRQAVRPRLRSELAAATSTLERHDLRSWTIGTLPRQVVLPGTGEAVRAYPALVDEGVAVGVRVLETPEAQRVAMDEGTRRLLLITVPSPVRHVQDRLDTGAQLALSAAPHGNARAVLDDALTAAVDALMAAAGGPAWDEAGFARLRERVAAGLADAMIEVVDRVVRILDASRDVQRRLEPLVAAPMQGARLDVERQLTRLVHPGFVTTTGAHRLPDVERYLRGAVRRLERLADAPAADLQRMRAVHDLEKAYARTLERWPRGRPLTQPLREVPWMLEELRVSHFAQSLGTRGPVSSKRIRRVLEEAG